MVSAQTAAQTAAPQPQAAQGALQDLQRSMRRAYRKAKRAIRGDAVVRWACYLAAWLCIFYAPLLCHGPPPALLRMLPGTGCQYRACV